MKIDEISHIPNLSIDRDPETVFSTGMLAKLFGGDDPLTFGARWVRDIRRLVWMLEMPGRLHSDSFDDGIFVVDWVEQGPRESRTSCSGLKL